MPKHGGKKSKGKRSSKGSRLNPSANTLTYSGPLGVSPTNLSTITRPASFTVTISSNATGFISDRTFNNPSLSADWGSLVSLYNEYRVLGTRCSWVPLYTGYSTTSTPLLASTLALTCIRNGSGSIPSNFAAALSVYPRRWGPIMDRMRVEFRMSGAVEASWFNVTGVGATCTFTVNADGLTPASVYGQLIVEMMLQFRNPN